MAKRTFTEKDYAKHPWFRALCSAIASCKNEQEAAEFLRDIATLSELQSFGERLEVAKQLSRGLTYREVAKNTGASTTTVTRVAKFMQNGEGGYARFLHQERTQREKNRFETPEDVKSAATQGVLRKYL